MDTKWNNTGKHPPEEIGKRPGDPGDELSPSVKGYWRRKRFFGSIGLLAFVLGMTLVLSSLLSAADSLVWERWVEPPLAGTWQNTQAFRDEASRYLREFLTIGAGGEVDFYSGEYWDGGLYDEVVVEQEAVRARWGFGETSVIEGVAVDRGAPASEQAPDSSDSAPAEPAKEREPDAAYQNDKNVLYWIQGQGKAYTNWDLPVNLAKFRSHSIEGYNVYLAFENGRVSVTKDGQPLDVYGNGFYDGDSQWFVPGYENFPASRDLEGVTVYMAVREEPIRYFSANYQTGGYTSYSGMYTLARQFEEGRRFYLTQAALFAAGLVCLLVWFFLRNSVRVIEVKIARWTVHVWTEVRFLLVAVCLLWALLPGFWNLNSIYDVLYSSYWEGGDSLAAWGAAVLRLALANIPALVVLFWLSRLIANDHRHNPREARRSLLRSLFRALRARDLKRGVEKRLSRRAALVILASLLLAGEALSLLINLTLVGYPSWLLWTVFLLPVLLAAGALSLFQRCQGDLARDLGRLADQVEAVRAGDLGKPLVLPEDADLRQTAESLNDIQAGMKAALEEQTRSERMKVELVSNVSHDLKTPLTSILSYAELLRQEEDLPPAAADYAKIIDEKAQRLKTMVEDVFEISKAAADQLPVHLEKLDLGKLLRQTLADMDGAIQASALTFRVDLPEEPVLITADGRRLYRVFQNLIDNALRYALEGSRVYLTLKTAEGTAEASVRNTSRTELSEGVDFTARFVRGDASRTDGGSGLGLSIAKSFVEACGGSFRVETVADLFTAFVEFPTAESEKTSCLSRP